MTWPADSPLVSSVIPARHFTPGPRSKGAIRAVVIHDMEAPEGASTAENVGHWWAGPTAPQSSCHYGVDSDSICQYVREADIAWHVPSMNHDSIGVEHAGYAKQSAADWDDAYSRAMLARSAPLFAELCTRYGLPAKYLDAAALKRGEKGITTHRQASLAYTPGGHTDPGPNFPIAAFVALVASHMAVPPLPPPDPPDIPAPTGEQTPILGAPLVTLEQAVAAVNKHRPEGANGYSLASVTEILTAYRGTTASVGVSFGVAVAQMVKETGWLTSWWSARPRRNPCGYGVTGATFATEALAKAAKAPYSFNPITGRWALGCSFDRWAPDAVDAHVGRLAAYAVAIGAETPNQLRLIDIALKVRALPDAKRGKSPTLGGLDGVWAVPGKGYGASIAAIIAVLAAA